MPKTPQVNFNFKNENVQVSTPLLGVSHVIARTTKGPFNDPSEVITSYPQFQRIFGKEIVPDGSVSNIEKALALGSKLRVSRVAGGAAAYGYAENGGSVTTFSMVLTSAADNSNTVTLNFKLRSKEQGTPFSFGGTEYDKIYLKWTLDSSGPNTKFILTQAIANTFAAGEIIDSRAFIAYNPTGEVIDYRALINFLSQVPNITAEVVGNFDGSPLDIYGVIAWMANNLDYLPSNSFVTATVYDMDPGDDGGDATATTWENAYDAIAEYNDAYQVILSHVHQHMPGSYATIYKTIADKVVSSKETKLLVELPKPTPGTTLSQYLTALTSLVGTVGQSKYICYYGGGIKYYDNLGIIRECDVLGTVIGLANTAESNFGPWYSPAGPNRGIVPDAYGPVMPNLGSPSQISELQNFADWYLNLFVIKDTRTAGKRTMLWHNFTSNPVDDSEKYISIVNLNLYLKKNIRPILEAHLEEPNTFSTWKDIYYQVKPILDDLVTRNALISPKWEGDQNASSYADLQVNSEEDVRAGKYRAVLSYKDIVTMQDVTLDIVIEASSNSVSIDVNE